MRSDRGDAVGEPQGEPRGVAVVLHGAGSSGRAMIELLGDAFTEAGLGVVAPDAAGHTWDLVERRALGPDAARVDAALSAGAQRWGRGCRVLAGFSDGASYALSLAVAGAVAATHVVGFSPGFFVPGAEAARPPVWISHGRDDPVLPIGVCSRRIVPALRERGHDVTYEEFDGGHGVPPEIARAAAHWIAPARA